MVLLLLINLVWFGLVSLTNYASDNDRIKLMQHVWCHCYIYGRSAEPKPPETIFVAGPPQDIPLQRVSGMYEEIPDAVDGEKQMHANSSYEPLRVPNHYGRVTMPPPVPPVKADKPPPPPVKPKPKPKPINTDHNQEDYLHFVKVM